MTIAEFYDIFKPEADTSSPAFTNCKVLTVVPWDSQDYIVDTKREDPNADLITGITIHEHKATERITLDDERSRGFVHFSADEYGKSALIDCLVGLLLYNYTNRYSRQMQVDIDLITSAFSDKQTLIAAVLKKFRENAV